MTKTTKTTTKTLSMTPAAIKARARRAAKATTTVEPKALLLEGQADGTVTEVASFTPTPVVAPEPTPVVATLPAGTAAKAPAPEPPTKVRFRHPTFNEVGEIVATNGELFLVRWPDGSGKAGKAWPSRWFHGQSLEVVQAVAQ